LSVRVEAVRDFGLYPFETFGGTLTAVALSGEGFRRLAHFFLEDLPIFTVGRACGGGITEGDESDVRVRRYYCRTTCA